MRFRYCCCVAPAAIATTRHIGTNESHRTHPLTKKTSFRAHRRCRIHPFLRHRQQRELVPVFVCGCHNPKKLFIVSSTQVCRICLNSFGCCALARGGPGLLLPPSPTSARLSSFPAAAACVGCRAFLPKKETPVDDCVRRPMSRAPAAPLRPPFAAAVAAAPLL